MKTVRALAVCVGMIALLGMMAPVHGGADTLLNPAGGKVWFVSAKTGSNSNPGTQAQPFKDIDKAIKVAQAGDTVAVAEGVYSGTFNIGYMEIDKPLKLYGSFAQDFSTRDIRRTPTLFQPDNASAGNARKAVLTFTREIDGAVVDGFVFDMGLRNAYSPVEGKPAGCETGMLLLPPEKGSAANATVTEPILSVPSAANGGELLIQNNAFINGASFGVQIGLRSGTCRILNNVFVANRMAAIEVYGTCRSTGGPKTLSLCGQVEIAHNTILFSWSRLKDFKDMGYGVRVMTKLEYNIHHNIIGGNIQGGVDHTRFNKNEWVRMDDNVFFVNKTADLSFSPASNTMLDLRVNQFGDLEFASARSNREEIPKTLPVDKSYLEGYLSARYSEQADFDRNSPANQWRSILGLNLQGKLTTKVSMFGNRYAWQKALELFGAVSGVGAQSFR
ncbi:MAG TPA: right-handed parallel beta-helix repeat-containing protein [Acidobacteriota bacterium]|nr:right-handed parallel beta-helix repeat-containing protein [Acidobacteriota bacterium]HNR39674.1 right-handed parallel beta-helix repeat-containing protein [Acidobacteriota bacterium]HNT99767.1 right-handed parallel beta-helix repeat-containing protein [Acidobacteriota bacterium]